jgi:outer membrane murein-binding lipoprotein Lpp
VITYHLLSVVIQVVTDMLTSIEETNKERFNSLKSKVNSLESKVDFLESKVNSLESKVDLLKVKFNKVMFKQEV